TATDVDGDVVDLAFQHLHELALRSWPLVVQTTQHATRRARDIALGDADVDALFGEALRVETLEKEAAVVSKHLRLDDHHAGQIGLDEVQGRCSCSIICNRYLP